MANKIPFIGYVSLMLMIVSCGKSGKGQESNSNAKEIVGSHHETYESEAFSLSYPNIFFIIMEDFSYRSSVLIIVHKEDNRKLMKIIDQVISEENEKTEH